MVGGHSYMRDALRLANGGCEHKRNADRVMAYAEAESTEHHLSVAAQGYRLTQPETRATRHRGAGASMGDLTAQMPGLVIQVLLSEGDSVTRGQGLVTLEAMKMELRVNAPGEGRVRRVLVKPGDVVERGQRLVEME